VRSGTQDLGTGTYTVMMQIAAEALGMPVSKVIFELGHTGHPEAPVSGGSQTVASVGPAVYAAAEAARDKLIAMAVGDATSPLHGLGLGAITADNGWPMERNSPIIAS
jgi:xanthine dehydrogenase YagR molybdenum-binding subunit